jgi:hypothetical protein
MKERERKGPKGRPPEKVAPGLGPPSRKKENRVMKDGCRYYRSLIPPALVGELDAEASHQLQAHLLECPSCTQEHGDMSSWIRELNPQADVEVPHHFLVLPEGQRFSLGAIVRGLLSRPHWAWGASMAVLVLAAAFLMGRPEKAVAPVSPGLTQADLESFRSGLLQTLEERSRQEKTQWLALLRSEMKNFSSALDERQKVQLRSAFQRMEANMGQSLSALETRQKDNTFRTNAQILEWLQTQQNSILELSGQISRVAVRGEQREAQTDATLAILFNTRGYLPSTER